MPRALLHRLFVAIYPSPDVARALLDSVARVELPEHRTTPVEQVHMTLQFIGDTSVRELERVRESVERAASGLEGADATITRLITLPERGLARLVAAQADAPPVMLELKRRLSARLARDPEERRGERFLPHLTLLRFRSPSRGITIDEPVGPHPFPLRSIALMRSTLDPRGARHEPVATFELR